MKIITLGHFIIGDAYMKPFYFKIVITTMLLMASICSQISAHETNIVHPGLTDNAVTTLNNTLINTYKTYIRDGSIHEDDFPRYKDHAYDPFTGGGWFGLPMNALDKAASLWNDALSKYNQGIFMGTDGAFHLLGRVAHLLEDMTSPGHTHADVHIPVWPFSSGDDFENWGTTHFSQISGLSPEIPGDGSVAAFITNLASFTYYKSAWYGVIEERTGTQPSSLLRSMFPSLYWNDGGWLGDAYWGIDNVGYFENFGNSDSWWPCTSNFTEDHGGAGGVRRIFGYFYIENSGGDDGYLIPATWEGLTNSKTLLRIWGDILYPKCVRYTGGLLKKFVDTVSPTGYASVSQGVTITPSRVILGQNFTVSFTLKEVWGLPITFENVAVAILRSDNSLLFDLAMYNNVTIPANGTWSQSPTGQIYTSNPPGTYKAVIRGKVPGGDWFDFSVTGSGVNPRSFTAVSCTYSLSSPSQSFGSSGGTGSVGVTAPSGCSWTATSNAGWITITSGSSGSGNGTVNYTVSANSSTSSRSGTMTIAGQTFIVNQSGVSCTYSLSKNSQSFGSSGGTDSVGVTTQSGCSWSASSNAGWITITSGSSGNGNGTVNYSVSANSSTSSHSGTMTIAGQTFTVSQSGIVCTYSINPTNRSHGSGAETGSISVTAGTGCSWTATSNNNWITITSGSSGSGNGTVYYSVAANSSTSSRTGTINIQGQTFTVYQAGMTCTYSISPTSRSHGSGAETGSVSVTAQSGCSWTATSNVSWITITSGNSGSGNGTVYYSVAANSSTSSRTGTINIQGQTFTVYQAGMTCTYSISPTSRSHGSGTETGSVSVTAQSGCSWTATSNVSWITITSGSSGTGNGTVYYSVSANTSTSSRTGTMTIAGQTFMVDQSGVGYGSIRVSIVPQEAANAGAQWKLTNESTWHNSGEIKYNVPFGTYQVEFKTITGWNTPPNKEVTIFIANPDIWINGDPYIPQTQTRTLTVASSNPSSGVPITVSPNDNNAQGSGATQFTRTYNNNTVVTLTAPSSAGGNNFQKWERNGVDYSTSQTTTVTMDTNYKMTAIFSQVSYTLNLVKTGNGSVMVNGTLYSLPWSGTFSSGSVVQLEAIPDAGWGFANWTGDLSSSAISTSINMTSNKNVTANFSQVNYTLNLSKSGNGSVRVNGTLRSLPWSGQLVSGTQVQLEAVPDTGWSFANWTGDLSGSAITTTITMNGNKNVTANFSSEDTIALLSPDSGTEFGPCNLYAGQIPTFNWDPHNSAYTKFTIELSTSLSFFSPIARATTRITSWIPSSFLWRKVIAQESPIYWRITGTKANKTTIESETRSFEVKTPQPVTINAPLDGTNLSPGVPPTFDFSSNCNVKFRIEFSPSNDFIDTTKIKAFNFTTKDPNVETTVRRTLTSGQWNIVKKLVGTGIGYFRVRAWDGLNRASISEVRVFTIGDQSCVYTLTVNTDPVGSGAVNLNPSKNAYCPGEQVTLTANPNTGYSFSSWSGDIDSSNGATAYITMDGDRTVTAYFSQSCVYTLLVGVNPPGSGTVSLSPNKSTYCPNEQVTLTASPNSGYTFSSWSGVDSSNGTSATVTMNSNRTVTANFSQNCTYTLSVNINPSGSGTVTKNPGKATYCPNEQVTLTAIPNSGYTFSSWSGVDSSNGTTAYITMNGNRTVTANFSQNCVYTLSVIVNPSGSGTISLSPNKSTYCPGEQVTLYATPNSGYTFSSWSGVDSSSGPIAYVTMNGSRVVTANFASAAILGDHIMSDGTGGDYRYCITPNERYNFSSTDPFALLYVYVSNVPESFILTYSFYKPDGTLHSSGNIPITNWQYNYVCLLPQLDIAAHPPASIPGRWRADYSYDDGVNILSGSEYFTIQ